MPSLCLYLLWGLVAPAAALYSRLPTSVRPLAYRLHLRPDIQTSFSFTGDLSIDLQMNETNELWLDCDPGLTVSGSSLIVASRYMVEHNVTAIGNRLRVVMSGKMSVQDDLRLNLSFSGNISWQQSGFYLSSYVINGTKRYLGSTQFEALGARKAFPCFDEPKFRSRFVLELTLDESWRAISNTPIASESVSGGLRRLVFGEMASTPVYLVAWVIYQEDGFARFPGVAVPTSCGWNTSYSLWANRQYTEQTELAITVAPLLVETMENYTGVVCKAVQQKMDLAAIPDFSAGAMENWGLITFRESGLLFDMNYSTTIDKQHVVMIVSHELTHQWFGNLVTPDWWSYTWLSEGFARYFQYIFAHQILPELQLKKQFLLDRRQLALEKDSPFAHPLTKDVLVDEARIEDMFDVITYDKGASIIHMIKSVLGEDEFKKGLNKYLTTVDNAGGVTTPDWFFSSFPTLPPLMRKWTETSGYPVLVVEETNNTILIDQIKIVGWNSTEKSHWLVPVSININGNVSWHYLQPNQTLKIAMPSNTNYYFINVNQTGYYRVLYKNPQRWLTPEADRSALVDDAAALAYSGLLSYSTSGRAIAFHLLEAPLDYFVWGSGLRAINKLASLVEGTNLQSLLTEIVLENIIDAAYTKVKNINNTSDLMNLHQINVLKHACYFGHEDCLKEAQKVAVNISVASPGKRAALLCTAVRRGNSSTWESIWNHYTGAKSPAESQLMLKALTCSTDRQLVRRFLALLLTDNIRKHDITSLISLLCTNRIRAEETYMFFKKNFTDIYNYFGETRSIRKILSALSPYLNQTHLSELSLMDSEKFGLNLTSFKESVMRSISWRSKVYQQLTDLSNTFDGQSVTSTWKPNTTPSSTPEPENSAASLNSVHLMIVFLSISYNVLFVS